MRTVVSTSLALALALGSGLALAQSPAPARPVVQLPAPGAALTLTPLGTYESGVFDEGAAEIGAFDPASARFFVTNADANTLDVLDLSDPAAPTLLLTIDLSPFGAGVNSVAVHDGLVAAAVEADPKQDPGQVVLFDVDGNLLATAPAGALPDMVTFTPDGSRLLVANEGEPDDDYLVDPVGSITIVDLSAGLGALTTATADFAAFDDQVLDPSIRIFGPGASVSQDLEPEYIATDSAGRFAWVACQENNALAIVNIASATVEALVGLGTKDHARRGQGLDPSNDDGAIAIAEWPVRGFYMPDSIAVIEVAERPFVLTANEGDSRDYDGYSEELRIKDLVLDPGVFPAAAELQADENLGRLKTTSANGDTDGDGDVDVLYSYGARSLSIFSAFGQRVWDSGDTLEQVTAAALPDDFNSTNDENGSFDNRSDDKGPEPEGLTTGRIGDRLYAFLGLERVGGVAVFDVTQPWNAFFVSYTTTRDFAGDAEAGTAGDLAPEGLVFIPAVDSPNGQDLLVVTHEVSGTTTVFAVTQP